MDGEIVHVAYSMSDAEAYVREHAERPSLAEQDRIARMLAECAEVRETAERQIAEFTEIRDRAVSVEHRLRGRLRGECVELREAAEWQIAEFTEIRDRAVSVERRLRARLSPLSGPVSAQDGAGVPEVGPEAPRAFLSDLRQYATVQQMNAAHEYGASRTQLNQPVLYKPMPY